MVRVTFLPMIAGSREANVHRRDGEMDPIPKRRGFARRLAQNRLSAMGKIHWQLRAYLPRAGKGLQNGLHDVHFDLEKSPSRAKLCEQNR
jgi:hypothetical protein